MCVQFFEKTEILQLDPFKKFGKPSKIATYFGGKAGYIQAVRELEEELYKFLTRALADFRFPQVDLEYSEILNDGVIIHTK